MSPSNLESLGNEVQRLAIMVQRSSQGGLVNADSRHELMDALDDLRAELVGPMKWPGTFLAPPEFAALQVAFNREIFQHVPGGSGSAKGLLKNGYTNGYMNGHVSSQHCISAAGLARLTKLDEDVLVRIVRLLIVNKMFVEVSERVFAHSPLSAEMADEMIAARLGGIFNEVFKASSSLADAIDDGGGALRKTAWETRFGMPMYEYFEKNQKSDRERMQKSMSISALPEIEELAAIVPWKNFRKIVDIGGSAGFLCSQLTLKYPHLQSVNQDLAQVINDQTRRIDKMPPKEKSAYDRVEFQAYDYFTPQPRKDADAFVLRRCLHNNADAECVKILKAVVPGLESGGPNARLLINEKLMPTWDEAKTRHRTKMLRREDIVMMISVGGKERTLEEFEALVRCADRRFAVDQVYRGKNYFAVISCKLVT